MNTSIGADFMARETQKEKIERLECELAQANKKAQELLEENQKLKATIQNYKKLGRKGKFDQAEIEAIKMYRIQGKSYREIAKLYECSVGLVYKLINE